MGDSLEKEDVGVFKTVEDGPREKKREFEEEVCLWEEHPRIEDQPGGRCQQATQGRIMQSCSSLLDRWWSLVAWPSSRSATCGIPGRAPGAS